ncbi:SPASM domain-containing protein [Chlorobium limicola]
MNISELATMGLQHIRNTAAETLYIRAGIDITRPVTFHALVNERCNCKCRHCEYWRQSEYVPEMSIEEWQQTLLSIKTFAGRYAINFSAGSPIMNSEEILRLMPANFREEKASEENLPCRIGLHEFFMRPDGDVRLCFHFPSIGNARTDTAREIWKGPKAQKIRKGTLECDKLCLLTCLSQKSLLNKVNQAITMLIRQKNKTRTQALSQ